MIELNLNKIYTLTLYTHTVKNSTVFIICSVKDNKVYPNALGIHLKKIQNNYFLDPILD